MPKESRIDIDKIDIDKMVDDIDRSIHQPGRNTAEIRSIRRTFSKTLNKAAPKEVIQISLSLLGRGGFTNRWISYELVCHHREAFRSLNATLLEQFGQGLDSWGAVDTFASYLSGPAWRESQVPDSLIHKWARSKDRWWRRAALVSTVPLNNKTRGGNGDAARTLAVCEMLLDDRDDMVVKALSWALRELAKRDAKAVSKFLSQHDDRIAALVRREVKNKLSTGLKNPKQKPAAAK
ncbi:MAG TPA: DNA alkylation repair protein [Blastocatellia bacterium]|nr:DNA alkylation repair protein [Blastocatellia bacterium]